MNIIKQNRKNGRISNFKKARHKTTVLKEILNSDLLTYKDKFYQGQSSGMCSFTNEQAYFKVSSDKEEMSIAEFERKLKEEISPYFRIEYNSNITAVQTVQGHSVYFVVPAYDGIIHLFNVGRNADITLPAESKGKVVNFKDEFGVPDEEALVWRGWVAAWEGCREMFWKFENEGISKAMVLTDKEARKHYDASQLIGFANQFSEYKSAVKEIETDNTLKFVEKKEEKPKEQE